VRSKGAVLAHAMKRSAIGLNEQFSGKHCRPAGMVIAADLGTL
jgi:hypothetical protein